MKEYWILDQNLNKIFQFSRREDKRISRILEKMPRGCMVKLFSAGIPENSPNPIVAKWIIKLK